MKRLFLITCFCLLSNCLHSIHHLNESDVAIPRKLEAMRQVETEFSQWVFLGFAYNTDYVDMAVEKLISKCPNGTVQSIAVRYSTDLGFLSWRNRIQLKGFCVE